MANARPAYHLKQVPGGGAYRSRCRQVATFNGVSQYVSIPPVTLAEDFEIELSVQIDDLQGQEQHIIDYTNDLYFKMTLNAITGQARLLVGDGVTWQVNIEGGPSVADNVLHRLGAKRVGNDFFLSVDAQVVASKLNAGAVAPKVALLARRANGTNHFNGGTRDVKIWTGGDRNTGALIRDYPLDDGYANNPVIRNSAATLGAELVVNGDFSDPAPVPFVPNSFNDTPAIISGGQLIITSDTGYARNEVILTTEVGRQYQVDLDMEPLTTAAVYMYAGDSDNSSNYFSVSGNTRTKKKLLFTATTTTTHLTVRCEEESAGTSAAINFVSIRQADGYGEMINGTEAMWSERCDL